MPDVRHPKRLHYPGLLFNTGMLFPPFVQEKFLAFSFLRGLHHDTSHNSKRMGATKPYLRGINLQSARLPARDSHLIWVLMCIGVSGQSDSLEAQIVKESYLRR